MTAKFVLVAAFAALATTAAPASAGPADLSGYTDGASVIRVEKTRGQVDVLSNVIYSQIKQTRAVRQLRMSLIVPRTPDLKPAIVYFPGGGFTSADHEKYIEMRMALAQAGFVVAAAEYRTVPDVFPAPIQDGKAAVRYLRAHAEEYGIDPKRIGVLGDSAGGYVAQMLGTTSGEPRFDAGDNLGVSSAVQAVVTLYGISNLTNIGDRLPADLQKVHESPAVTEALLLNGPAFRDFPGAPVTSDPAKALDASPVGHIDGSEPLFLIFHGSADTHVSPWQSEQLYKALKAKGVSADYVLVEGAQHGDLTWFQAPIIERVVGWFKDKLGAPIKGGAKAADPNARL